MARAAEATAVITCCEVNADYIAATVPAGLPEVRVIRHGVELDRFTPRPRPAAAADAGAEADAGARIVTVGRLVEKKGFPDLLEALGRLQATGAESAVRCTATDR